VTGILCWVTRRCPVADALATLPGRWTVFVSTPREFVVTLVDDGVLRGPLPAGCFQLQAFDGRAELRWLADGAAGRAVWLAEAADQLPDRPTGQREFRTRLDTRAVLWGLRTTDPAVDGFSVWREARVGSARYPCPPGVSRQDRAVLRGVEYVAVDARHGNAGIFEQRLLTIATADLSAAPVTAVTAVTAMS